MAIKVVCSWCGKTWHKEGVLVNEGVSHSICSECASKMRATFPTKVPTGQ